MTGIEPSAPLRMHEHARRGQALDLTGRRPGAQHRAAERSAGMRAGPHGSERERSGERSEPEHRAEIPPRRSRGAGDEHGNETLLTRSEPPRAGSPCPPWALPTLSSRPPSALPTLSSRPHHHPRRHPSPPRGTGVPRPIPATSRSAIPLPEKSSASRHSPSDLPRKPSRSSRSAVPLPERSWPSSRTAQLLPQKGSSSSPQVRRSPHDGPRHRAFSGHTYRRMARRRAVSGHTCRRKARRRAAG